MAFGCQYNIKEYQMRYFNYKKMLTNCYDFIQKHIFAPIKASIFCKFLHGSLPAKRDWLPKLQPTPCFFLNIPLSGKHHTVIGKFFAAGFLKFLQMILYFQVLLLLPCHVVDNTPLMHHNKTVSNFNGISHIMGNH